MSDTRASSAAPAGTNPSAALSAIVLAAGHGTRMKSDLPKPLHPLCGRPMVGWVLNALADSNPARIVVVVGHESEQVTRGVQASLVGSSATVSKPSVTFVEQRLQRGTGDAASVGLTGLVEDVSGSADVIILPGDTPLLRPETIASFVRKHRELDSVCTLLSARIADPTGYGRILRDADGLVERIVEHADANEQERQVDEVNTSIYCFRQSLLAPALRRVTPDNAQGEFYLTDVVEVLRSTGHKVHAYVADDAVEISGVNDRSQLATCEVALRQRLNADWMRRGITMSDPAAVYVDVDVQLGVDVTLHPGTTLKGRTVVGDGAELGPNTTLTECAVGVTARVSHSVGTGAEVGPGAQVGPYAVLEPGAQVGSGEAVGSFQIVTSGEQS